MSWQWSWQAKSEALRAPEARDYITFIEDLAEVPVAMIAVGPSGVQTIMRRWGPRP